MASKFLVGISPQVAAFCRPPGTNMALFYDKSMDKVVRSELFDSFLRDGLRNHELCLMFRE